MSSDNHIDRREEIDGPILSFVKRFEHASVSGDEQALEEIGHEVLAYVTERTHTVEPVRSLRLTAEASDLENNGEWLGAEAVYQEILRLPDLNPSDEYRTRAMLSRLYGLLDRRTESLTQTELALNAARQAASETVLRLAIAELSPSLMRYGHSEKAMMLIQEALSISDDDLLRAGILVLRAEFARRAGRYQDAEQDLDEVFRFMEPMARTDVLAGVQWRLSQAWLVASRLALSSGHPEEALNASERAVSIVRGLASLPHSANIYTNLSLADVLVDMEEALTACNRTAEAIATAQERKAIRLAARLPDSMHR